MIRVRSLLVGLGGCVGLMTLAVAATTPPAPMPQATRPQTSPTVLAEATVAPAPPTETPTPTVTVVATPTPTPAPVHTATPTPKTTSKITHTAAPSIGLNKCDPNYTPCVPIASDVDCAGGGGDGPAYVKGPVKVVGKDIYGLDRDHNGIGCE